MALAYFQHANNEAETILKLFQCFVSGMCGHLKYKTAVKQLMLPVFGEQNVCFIPYVRTSVK